MKINYNITGARRKSLAGAVSEALDAPVHYLGAPTFAYEIGSYRIDRNGTLEGEDSQGLIADLSRLHGFTAVSAEYDSSHSEAELGSESLAGLQEGSENNPYKDYLNDTQNDMNGEEPNLLTIEVSKEGFTEAAVLNLKRLVESKETLIKKAIGTDSVPIAVGEETIGFPWFYGTQDSDEIKAYTHFIASLCSLAKNQKRVNVTDKATPNERYAFRCFLLRLGFIGPEYKNERKILLKNLDGSSAFKSGQRKAEEV
jgi:hypothetical protein